VDFVISKPAIIISEKEEDLIKNLKEFVIIARTNSSLIIT